MAIKLNYLIKRQYSFALNSQFMITWTFLSNCYCYKKDEIATFFLWIAWIGWVCSLVSELLNIPIITLTRWLAHVLAESRGCYLQHLNFHSLSAALTLFTSVTDIDSGRFPGGRVDSSVDSLLRRLQWAWNVLNWSSNMALLWLFLLL